MQPITDHSLKALQMYLLEILDEIQEIPSQLSPSLKAFLNSRYRDPPSAGGKRHRGREE